MSALTNSEQELLKVSQSTGLRNREGSGTPGAKAAGGGGALYFLQWSRPCTSK